MYLKFIVHIPLYVKPQPNLKIDKNDLEHKNNRNG